MPEMINCRNCGAPLTGCECEYCGTKYREIGDDRLGILYADNAPVLEIEDKPAPPFQWPDPIPGVWTH